MRNHYPDDLRLAVVNALKAGVEPKELTLKPERTQGYSIAKRTLFRWIAEHEHWLAQKNASDKKLNEYLPMIAAPKKAASFLQPQAKTAQPRVLLFDLETLPNDGFFFDCFSDRGIPTEFIKQQKSICTIAWKWVGETNVQVIRAKAPYDDKDALMEFMPIYERADYVVAHFGDGFDIPFLRGRLFINQLPPLVPVASIDTYKLAKRTFGRSLNSNKLDHLGEILGVGRKNKTNATLWVRCAKGEEEAIQEMAEYNAQDVLLLEQVYLKLKPYVKSKLNHNLHVDSVTKRCKACGSEALDHIGFEFTAEGMKDRCRCKDCGHCCTFRIEKKKIPATIGVEG